MENEKKLGQETAFPAQDMYSGQPIFYGGMSKRYWTAVMIAQGRFSLREPDQTIQERIEYCYRVADELLKQENQ